MHASRLKAAWVPRLPSDRLYFFHNALAVVVIKNDLAD
jgi:hypothetical protein